MQVEGPAGHQVHSSKQKTEEKFVFVAIRRGLYKFCFYNRNSIHETVDFDFHVGHITPSEEHVKDGLSRWHLSFSLSICFARSSPPSYLDSGSWLPI